jgi:hypothetical protein
LNLLKPDTDRFCQVLLSHAGKPPAMTQPLADVNVNWILHTPPNSPANAQRDLEFGTSLKMNGT